MGALVGLLLIVALIAALGAGWLHRQWQTSYARGVTVSLNSRCRLASDAVDLYRRLTEDR